SLSRLLHQGILFGTPLPDTWFITIGAVEIKDQQGERLLGACRRQPSDGIYKADPLKGDLLTPSGLDHNHADQVVNQSEDNEIFKDPVNRFALEYIQAHGGFQMGKIGFNAPPSPVELC